MKYRFDVKEVSYGCLEIEADSYEEAERKATAEYERGNTYWSNGEYEITEAEERSRGEAR